MTGEAASPMDQKRQIPLLGTSGTGPARAAAIKSLSMESPLEIKAGRACVCVHVHVCARACVYGQERTPWGDSRDVVHHSTVGPTRRPHGRVHAACVLAAVCRVRRVWMWLGAWAGHLVPTPAPFGRPPPPARGCPFPKFCPEEPAGAEPGVRTAVAASPPPDHALLSTEALSSHLAWQARPGGSKLPST